MLLHRTLFAFAVLFLATSTLVAQQPAQEIDLSTIPLETKREWVRTQMVREFATGLDAAKLQKIDDTVANLVYRPGQFTPTQPIMTSGPPLLSRLCVLRL